MGEGGRGAFSHFLLLLLLLLLLLVSFYISDGLFKSLSKAIKSSLRFYQNANMINAEVF